MEVWARSSGCEDLKALRIKAESRDDVLTDRESSGCGQTDYWDCWES